MPKPLVSTEKPELNLKKTVSGNPELILKNKTVVIAGKFYGEFEDLVKAVVLSEGGKIVETVTDQVDYVIQGRLSAKPAAVREAEKLMKSGVPIKIIEDDSLYSFLVPDEDTLARLFRAGDAERFKLLLGLTPGQYVGVSLSGHDLSGGTFDGFPLERIEFKACSFKNATLRNSDTYCAKGLDLEGARLHKVNLRGFEDCQLQKTHLTDLYIMDSTYRCDFSDSKFESVRIYGLRFESCKFKNNILRKGVMTQSYIEDCDFSSVDWKDLSAYHVTFYKCKLTNASLQNCWFIDCKFEDCDLTGCNFTGSNLALSVFKNSKTQGANFSRCNLAGGDTTNLDEKKATGLKEALAVKASKPDVTLLPAVVQLSQESRTATKYELSVQLETDRSTVTCTLESAPRWTGGVEVTFKDIEQIETEDSCGPDSEDERSIWSSPINMPSVSAAFRFISCVYSGYRPAIETIVAKMSKGQISSKEFHSLAVRAVCESAGLDTPSEKEFDKLTKARKSAATKEKDELIAFLRGGHDGIAKFNDRARGKKKLSFKKVDLSGCDLTAVNLTGTELNGANLENCVLKNSILQFANLSEANLTGANLDGADCTGVSATSTNFSNASICGAKLDSAKLHKAIFHKSNCADLDLRLASILGADFSSARMDDVRFENTQYNQDTKLPQYLLGDKRLLWAGTGVNPAKVREVLESTPAEPLDFGKFLERLENSIEKERLKKAIKMLQAESFQLFSEVKADQMLGIVKSQTDPDLVYSCLLTNEGKFCCGTQNLNSCGGLRGALCKHLLVLLIGLTKAGKLDANDADKWARASTLQTPKMEKDAMSETFLRYKGAEAGEIDWRPTETIPEDYYAF